MVTKFVLMAPMGRTAGAHVHRTVIILTVTSLQKKVSARTMPVNLDTQGKLAVQVSMLPLTPNLVFSLKLCHSFKI